MDFVVLTVTLVVALLIYFTPTFVAVKRDHRNVASITVVNLFLGWSLIGWVIALAWAFSANVNPCAD